MAEKGIEDTAKDYKLKEDIYVRIKSKTEF
jgi:hypothetical protein